MFSFCLHELSLQCATERCKSSLNWVLSGDKKLASAEMPRFIEVDGVVKRRLLANAFFFFFFLFPLCSAGNIHRGLHPFP